MLVRQRRKNISATADGLAKSTSQQTVPAEMVLPSSRPSRLHARHLRETCVIPGFGLTPGFTILALRLEPSFHWRH